MSTKYQNSSEGSKALGTFKQGRRGCSYHTSPKDWITEQGSQQIALTNGLRMCPSSSLLSSTNHFLCFLNSLSRTFRAKSLASVLTHQIEGVACYVRTVSLFARSVASAELHPPCPLSAANWENSLWQWGLGSGCWSCPQSGPPCVLPTSFACSWSLRKVGRALPWWSCGICSVLNWIWWIWPALRRFYRQGQWERLQEGAKINTSLLALQAILKLSWVRVTTSSSITGPYQAPETLNQSNQSNQIIYFPSTNMIHTLY